MGWSIGFDSTWDRDIGYGVPAWCDFPACPSVIDRGLAYVCGSDPRGGDEGCGLYFCSTHLHWLESQADPERLLQVCEACRDDLQPFPARPDHPTWINHKLNDSSWGEWRTQNPERVIRLVELLSAS